MLQQKYVVSNARQPKKTSQSHLRILIFLWSNLMTALCKVSRRTWILQDLWNTIPASISIPRNMSLAFRDRSESWWSMFIIVWEQTSSNAVNKTGFRSLRPSTTMKSPSSSPKVLPSLLGNRDKCRGSTILWWNGIFTNSREDKTIKLRSQGLYIKPQETDAMPLLFVKLHDPDIPPYFSKMRNSAVRRRCSQSLFKSNENQHRKTTRRAK